MCSRLPLLLGLLVSACRWGAVMDDHHTRKGGPTSGSGGSGARAPYPGGTGSMAPGSGPGLPKKTGCGVRAPVGAQDRTLEVDGFTRTFLLSVPPNYDFTKRYALVFAWHGQAGDGLLARRYFEVEDAAGGSAIFVYPDGLPQAQADGDTAWDLSPNGVDVALFDAMLTSLYSDYCVDPARIFSTGHSYGAYMTNRLACSRSNVLRGVAPVAGGPPFGPGDDAPCGGAIAAFLVHGTKDTDVELDEGKDARDQFLHLDGCATSTHAVTPAPCVAYDRCYPQDPVVWCMHPNDHDWPDFAGRGIWAFFAGLE